MPAFPLLRWLMPLALIAAPAPALADGLIDNVNGMTLDKDGRITPFYGLLIDGQGRVLRLLDRKGKRPEKLDFKLDGKGQTLIPGFIDGHAHLMALGFSKLTLDLSPATSLADVQSRIQAYIAANPGRKWIVGRGWDAAAWNLGRPLTAQDLDAAASDLPIWIVDRDGQAGWANSAAMAAAGITAATKAPTGGRIDMVGGKPSGIFAGTAMNLIARLVPPPLPKDNDLAIEAAQKALLPYGITTVTDINASIADWQAYRRAGDRNALRLRVIVYGAGVENTLLIAGSSPTPWLYDGRLKAVGTTFLIDGAVSSRGAWMKADYPDQPKYRGLPQLYDAPLRNQMSRAAMDGFQVALGARGDQANAEALAAIAEVALTYTGDRRWRLEHAEILDPADFPQVASNGIIASFQPANQLRGWSQATQSYGDARLTGAYAWGSLSQRRVPLAFGSDSPAGNLNPFVGMAAAITREQNGQPFGGWHPQERIDFTTALRAYTQGAAHAAFAEDRLGSLEPGRFADFLILDRDISVARPADLAQTQVLESWIGGRRIYVKEGTAGATR